MLFGIPAPYDAIIAVFGFPIVLVTIFDIVRWTRKWPNKKFSRYGVKGIVIGASDAWLATTTENAVSWWEVSESGIEAIKGTMGIVNGFLPKQITSLLPEYFIFLLVASVVMYYVLYG